MSFIGVKSFTAAAQVTKPQTHGIKNMFQKFESEIWLARGKSEDMSWKFAMRKCSLNIIPYVRLVRWRNHNFEDRRLGMWKWFLKRDLKNISLSYKESLIIVNGIHYDKNRFLIF